MKAEDLKGKTADELQKTLLDTRKEQFNAKMQRAAGQLENTASMRTRRRDIARIKTAITAAKNNNGPDAKAAPAKKKSAKA